MARMGKMWTLRDPDLPEEFHTIRKVFIGTLITEDRKRNESLHAYLIRKGIACPCRNCRLEREKKNNTQLEL